MGRERPTEVVWYIDGQEYDCIYLQDGEPFWIGSDPGCDLVLMGRDVAPYHLSITRDYGAYGFWVCKASWGAVYLEDGTVLPDNENFFVPEDESVYIGNGSNSFWLSKSQEETEAEYRNTDYRTGSSQDQEALSAYGKFLARDSITWNSGSSISTGSLQFMLFDINSDGASDLILKNSQDTTYGAIGFYMYNPAKRNCYGVGYGQTTGWYYPGSGVYLLDWGSQQAYYYIKDMSQYDSYESYWDKEVGNCNGDSSGDERYVWHGVFSDIGSDAWAQGGELSQSEFETQLNTLTNGVQKKLFRKTGWIILQKIERNI